MKEKTIEERAAEARRAYHREWTRKNPEKVKAIQERYWKKKAETVTPETANG